MELSRLTFGFRQPIVVDKDMVVIAGHTRLAAAKKLKFKEVQSLIGANTNGQKATEYLYSNMPIQGEIVDIDSADLPF